MQVNRFNQPTAHNNRQRGSFPGSYCTPCYLGILSSSTSECREAFVPKHLVSLPGCWLTTALVKHCHLPEPLASSIRPSTPNKDPNHRKNTNKAAFLHGRSPRLTLLHFRPHPYNYNSVHPGAKTTNLPEPASTSSGPSCWPRAASAQDNLSCKRTAISDPNFGCFST